MSAMSTIKQFAASSAVPSVFGLGAIGGVALAIAAPANATPSHDHAAGSTSTFTHAISEKKFARQTQ